ncbi:hypothetical protein Hanom_Chr09g00827121 [Helianthus anomalus]
MKYVLQGLQRSWRSWSSWDWHCSRKIGSICCSSWNKSSKSNLCTLLISVILALYNEVVDRVFDTEVCSYC